MKTQTVRINVYLDNESVLLETLTPPEKFRLNTESISDGEHTLIFAATDNGSVVSKRTLPFTVQNGPSIAVHGIVDGDVLRGDVGILANAYGSKIGDEFEPVRMETPAPIPTWAWVLVLSMLAWGVGYIALEMHDRIDTVVVHKGSSPSQPQKVIAADASIAPLGEQIYGNNCASCHQLDGSGLVGVFPPLVNNYVVSAENPNDHIRAVLNGVADKILDGIAYPGPMPPFGSLLSNEEVAAVVNHERIRWGSGEMTVTAADVEALR